MFRRFRRVEEVTAFALSGGGSRSAAQVGVLKALLDAGVSARLLTGTSAGAVNAVWCALYPDRLDRLEAIWLALRTRDVFPGGRVGALYNMARRGHVYSARAWEAYLRREMGTARFEDMLLPCAVTAVRLSDGKRVILDSGEVVPALMASTAIPGIFPPYAIDGEMYVDGGVL